MKISLAGYCHLGIAFLLCSLSSAVYADTVRVAVASNFADTLRIIKPQFEQRSGHHLVISSAASGILYAQITQGAPYDVYLAANADYPARLEQQGRAVPGSRQIYAIGRLALVSNNRPLLEHTELRAVLSDDQQRIAIANPQTAPYGAAALETLQRLGLYDQTRSRLVMGENVAQALQYVVSGNAGLGLVALAQVLGKERPWRLHYREIPAGLHAPIEQQMVLLAGKNPAAASFYRFMCEAETQTMLHQQGYDTRCE
ncbi:MAG: molybdate ABC transporter substrate-binding protein [Gammaproteobacteria bacterium RBG_16_57_12]|nr:MAG: molybdate ABC transporter substrate-binding protein [Gammaproteobacteria bacterium RBG_16_57_12]